MTIKEMREKTGLSQTKFAELVKVSNKTISAWEQGYRKTPDYMLFYIEYYLSHEGYFVE